MKLPIKQTNHFSIYRAFPYWYIVALSKDLKNIPLRVQLWDTPLVVFRNQNGKAHTLLDRCAHRNVPFSLGKIQDGKLQCGYHGWLFDEEGICRNIPALCNGHQSKTRKVPAFPTIEQQGYIWVYADHQSLPNHQPYSFPHLDDPGYTVISYQTDFEATIHSTAENILDVPHTAFLHKGLFRNSERNPLRTKVKRYNQQVQCEYIGEPRPTGLLGKLLAPEGGHVTHFDRFILPSVAQVEYLLGEKKHFITTSFLSPMGDFKTRMYSVVAAKLGFTIPMLKHLVTPIALKIIKQDAQMLNAQTRSIRIFGGEHYTSTAADLLGPEILRLLKKASNENLALNLEPSPQDAEYIIDNQLLA